MFDLFETSRIANIYCEERVQAAKTKRFIRMNRESKSGLLQRTGDFLIVAGQKLKALSPAQTTIQGNGMKNSV